MTWLDEMEAADSAYPGDISYPPAGTRAGRGLYQLHAGLDDGHLSAARDLIADWYARQANHVNEARHALRQPHARQAAERLAAGEAWQEHDLVLCREDGTPLDLPLAKRAPGEAW
jgi:hypothetical protein